MSFSFVIDGLTISGASTTQVVEPPETWVEEPRTFFECFFPGPIGQEPPPRTCPTTRDKTVALSASLAGLGSGADYYAIKMWFNGPGGYATGAHGCTSLPELPCSDWWVAQDVGLTHSWVSIGGEPLASSGSTISPPDQDNGIWRFARDEVPNQFGYMVNPAPTWPVPDAEGNEFGRCLFTATQIPAGIDAVVTSHNNGMATGVISPVPCKLRAAAVRYHLIPPEPTPSRRMQIIGAA